MKREIKLQCDTARNLSIFDFLRSVGITPRRENSREAWYASPFRSEAIPSFKVSKVLNRWFDHGAGIGGNIIDLVVALNNDCSVQDALAILEKGTSLSFHEQIDSDSMPERNRIEILSVTPIQHPGLKRYYSSRAIPDLVISRYAYEVHYSLGGNRYFAIGMKNVSGGWELRNQYYKNSSSPKDYTLIRNCNSMLSITEGMFDFFTLVSEDPELAKTSDFVILNSLSFLDRVTEILPFYKHVDLYLDNDSSGKQAAKKLCSLYNVCSDLSSRYSAYKDLNECANSANFGCTRKMSR
ncbi:toprim domain-containing protein [Prolixibacter sp. NT017]|uniref:toprim domain-containing protein n=1 Tax=Prolixibacter sp. NT017 TaxID=2652390 RepID=UPI0012991DB0|nr:toprim domain-containing protein [Prolixibacter sp. NT017]